MLRGMRVGPRTVEEAVGKAKGHHYQLACTAVFQGQHNCICESAISHPNQVRRMPTCCTLALKSVCFSLVDIVRCTSVAAMHSYVLKSSRTESAISHPNQVRQMIHCCASSMHEEGGNLSTP